MSEIKDATNSVEALGAEVEAGEQLVKPTSVPSAYPGRKSTAMDPGPRGTASKARTGTGARNADGASPKKKPQTALQKREHIVRVHRWMRYGVQLVFFILAPALFSGAFNGIKYLCTQVGLGEAMEPTSFLVQLVVVLAFTILFGRFFCGYACAFGTLGDYLYNGFEFVRKRTSIPRPVFPITFVRVLSLMKFVVLAFVCVACFLGVWANYSSDSPWVAFAAILAGSLEGVGWLAIVLLIAVMVGMVVRERFFCQFLCPLGAVFSLMPVLGCSEYVRTRAHCARSCGRCNEVCPVDIWPDADVPEHGECISCGRCADVCALSNVNMVAIEKTAAKLERLKAESARVEKAREAAAKKAAADEGDEKGEQAAKAKVAAKPKPRPLRKVKENWYLLRGSEVGYVAFKALLLLVLCWMIGAARYVPPFVDVFGFNPLMF